MKKTDLDNLSSVSFGGRHCHLLLLALDAACGTDDTGKVVNAIGDATIAELQAIRNALFAVHEHEPPA
jgi:hypothetical protein